ncbi:uncharacterized protein L201_006824 [Kwoniella dendrophila CBS 6074]|uniref:Uncharacterized protein n=1 Tax=Kwoniella dendrophila CBS 6074 TaxID=1295534 RepID=A0AAX4K509_9TREE
MLFTSPIPPPNPPIHDTQTTPISKIDITGIEADDEDEDTSDDDQGVFLGHHRPDELEIIAKLSVPSPSCSSATPSPVIRRVKKRDSREFMRRKTILLSSAIKPISSPNPSPRPVLAERQLYPEEESDASSSSSPTKNAKCSCTTPLKSHDASDLTFDFAGFHLSSPRPPTTPTADVEETGSDKENVPILASRKRTVVAESADLVVIGQVGSSEGSEDELPQLDMGGLRLSDFSDPETGFENNGSVELKQSDEEDNAQETPSSPTAVLLEDGDVFSDPHSPLPVVRAGPVVIPVLSSHHFTSIRAETGSPCRALQPPPMIPIEEPQESSLELPRADSPLDFVINRPIMPNTTPNRSTPLPPPELVQRGAKLLKASASSKPINISTLPTKSASRALTIRGQLDTALSTTKMSALGPPQRSVSSSSSGSTSSTGSKLSSSTSSSASRSAFATASTSSHTRPVIQTTRPIMTSKPAAPMPKKHTVVPLASSTTKALPRPALAAKRTLPALSKSTNTVAIVKPAIASSIPLKRPAPITSDVKPLAVVSATNSIPTSTRIQPVVPTRPTLGLPSRNLHLHPPQPASLQAVPVFSVGTVGEVNGMNKSSFRSPAKAGILKKTLVEKATPRKLGTPLRMGTPRQPATFPIPCLTFSANQPLHDVSAVPVPLSNGPPATATSQATDNASASSSISSSSPEPPRGSSADHEEVSVQLAKPPSSPVKSPSPKKVKRPVGRPRKMPQPQSTITVHPVANAKSGSKSTASTPAVGPPLMSEKELKMTTHRNTTRNQVYHCAIDRQIIRQSGPRPPSPTSKIRTTAERNEEEKKKAREDRAKKRKGGKGQHQDEEEPERPIVEKLVQDKFPGDETDFETPRISRPLKKNRKDNNVDKESKSDDKDRDRAVTFDKGLTIIRDDGSIRPPSREDKDGSSSDDATKKKKGCLKIKVDLDHHGNLHDAHRPIENLKRTRVVVNAVFYDGEEPVAFSYSPSNGTRSKKK